MAFVVALAAPLYAADSYRVTVTLYPGDDAAAVAKRLAAIYRGELERPVEAQGDTFVMSITLGAAEAHLLSRDPHVEAVQPAGATAAIPGATAPATNAAVPSQAIETHAGSQWTSGEYKYDGSGNIRSIGDDVFLYDGSSRLVYGDAGWDATTSTRRRQEYSYDGFGNLHTVLTNGADRTRIAINPRTNRAEYPRPNGQPDPTPPGGGSYTMAGEYDSRGNLTQVLINSNDRFEYDALDMVTKAYMHEPTLHWQSHIYNASDERIGTIRLTGQNGADSGSDWTFRDTGGQVLRRLSRTAGGDWSWNEDYIYRGSLLLAAELPDETRHFHLDHLGTPRLITGNGGMELSRHTYYAFGAETGIQTSGEKQFTGHERDSATLDYMHARYYSPQMGRFLSVDPELNIATAIREPQQWNRYSYVVNNPLKYTDPDGKDKFMAWLLGGAFRDVNTWDALKGALSPGPMVRAVEDGRQEWAEDHRAATHGFSPVPTTRGEVAMAPVFMMLGPGGGAARTTLAEAKTLVGAWSKGTFTTLAKTIGYHFEKHGAEVGAKSMLQYLRKAYEFNRNLRGAEKFALENGATRYVKNGYYVIKDEAGRILSYGRVTQ